MNLELAEELVEPAGAIVAVERLPDDFADTGILPTDAPTSGGDAEAAPAGDADPPAAERRLWPTWTCWA